jgi:hypothetical protein
VAVEVVECPRTRTAVVAEVTASSGARRVDHLPRRSLEGRNRRARGAVIAWCESAGLELDGTRWEVYGHWADDQTPDEYEIEVYWRVLQ